ncbi:hypothetical protein LJC04_05805, partial [Ruminococcaceae bacterium OttesenSCG-928-O06]|nr:hypothetical protein [Ruminococcaceae bacterium OttesenSCG-928-O06]
QKEAPSEMFFWHFLHVMAYTSAPVGALQSGVPPQGAAVKSGQIFAGSIVSRFFGGVKAWGTEFSRAREKTAGKAAWGRERNR